MRRPFALQPMMAAMNSHDTAHDSGKSGAANGECIDQCVLNAYLAHKAAQDVRDEMAVNGLQDYFQALWFNT